VIAKTGKSGDHTLRRQSTAASVCEAYRVNVKERSVPFDTSPQHLVDWIVTEFNKDNGIDLADDPMAMQRIREAAATARIELSSTNSTEINLPFITADSSGPKHLRVELTRATLQRLDLGR
jgi:hypothetical protein